MIDAGNVPDEWLKEILRYLLGKPSTVEGTYALPYDVEPVQGSLMWWMFEGKRYDALSLPLSQSWEALAKEISRLRQMFSPRLRLVDHPVEPVDWSGTYLRSGGNRPREFVVLSSGMGVSQNEWDALCGWCAWISTEWAAHAARWNKAAGGHNAFSHETADLRASGLVPMNKDLRLKWLRIAIRSRLPLLRNIVAETLKFFDDVETMDRVPLPKTREHVFELLGMVRMIQVFQPDPPCMQWLIKENGQALQFPEGTFDCHTSWSREAVIDKAYCEDGLSSAMRHFDLRVHCRPDLLCQFTPAKGGFAGMIVEFKSGGQTFSDALHQLRMYRKARKAQNSGRLVLWGIVEKAEKFPLDASRLEWLKSQAEGQEDVWLFTGADPVDLKQALATLGLSPNNGK